MPQLYIYARKYARRRIMKIMAIAITHKRAFLQYHYPPLPNSSPPTPDPATNPFRSHPFFFFISKTYLSPKTLLKSSIQKAMVEMSIRRIYVLIGYARLSTQDQDLSLQLDALERAKCERVYTEKASGAQRDRPERKAALDYLRQGDTLIVWKLDRHWPK